MPLDSGCRLGPYEIVSPIGAGGMGEVYEAKDTRLGRTVAIKILPEGLAESPERRARFEREARTVSQLSHPHVCTLHDVGEEEGVHFLVLEHLEGETLAERLERDALPLEETLRYSAQIAEALDAAHRRGVVHRDLKPANVMVTSSGVKLLDFGLARIAAGGDEEVADLPTMTMRDEGALTDEGTVLGTFPYMSPEQVEGAEADARSDVFALGAVLYEMVTGRRAFTGESAASVMAAVLREEPDPLSEVQPVSPPALDHVVSRCLAKDPERRWQTARDVAEELRWIREDGSQAGVAAPVAERRRGRERLAWAVASLMAVAAILLGTYMALTTSEESPIVHAELTAPEGRDFDLGWGLAVSPDGTRVAYVVEDPDLEWQIWIRPLDGAEARFLPGTEGGHLPFWSPDSEHLGFFADGQLKRVPVTGGPTQTLCPAPSPRGGAWGEGDFIVFSGTFRRGLFRVPATGGTPLELTRLDEERGEISHRWPHFLPGGERLLFLAQTSEGFNPEDESTIEALDLQTGDRTTLVRANSSMAYSPTGHLLYWKDFSLMARPFDPRALEIRGEPSVLLGRIGYSDQERARFSISDESILVYQSPGEGGGLSRLAWFDRQGNRIEDLGPEGDIAFPQLSHDGGRVAFSSKGDIWIRDLSRAGATRLTFHPAPDFGPIWSPDDRWIVYGSFAVEGAAPGIAFYRMASSGAGEPELLFRVNDDGSPGDWSPDGERLVFETLHPETEFDLGLFSFAEGETEELLRTPDLETAAQFSPDGRWLVYTVTERTGRPTVFVRSLETGGGRWQISSEAGGFPRWSSDGPEIFYIEPPNRLMVVDVETADGFRAGVPRLLFEARWSFQGGWPYDVHPDGERILINLATEREQEPPIQVVLNWSDLLEP